MSYVYPFGKNVTTGRIDQGQDFGGTGPIFAIGRARIVSTGAPGWPGGAGVLYKLLDGPKAGRYVFVNEGIKVSVHPGQLVKAGEVIGHLIPGSETGIEIGWAHANGEPISHPEYSEGMETRGGKAMAAFLAGLPKVGAHGGFQVPLPAGERKRLQGLAKEENLGESVLPGGGEIADEILGGILGDLAKSAEPLMLNIALVGGGAFLIYYGVALLAGVNEPGLKILRGAKRGGEAAAVAA